MLQRRRTNADRDGVVARSCGFFVLLGSWRFVTLVHIRRDAQKLSRNEFKPAGKIGCWRFGAKCEGFDIVSSSGNVGHNEFFPTPEAATPGLSCFVQLFFLCNKRASQEQDGIGPCG